MAFASYLEILDIKWVGERLSVSRTLADVVDDVAVPCGTIEGFKGEERFWALTICVLLYTVLDVGCLNYAEALESIEELVDLDAGNRRETD